MEIYQKINKRTAGPNQYYTVVPNKSAQGGFFFQKNKRTCSCIRHSRVMFTFAKKFAYGYFWWLSLSISNMGLSISFIRTTQLFTMLWQTLNTCYDTSKGIFSNKNMPFVFKRSVQLIFNNLFPCIQNNDQPFGRQKAKTPL